MSCSSKFVSIQSGAKDLDRFYSRSETIKLLFTSKQSCYEDYSFFNEDKNNYTSNWSNQTNSTRAFSYMKSSALKDNIYLGKYGTYLGGGYVYKFIGNSTKIKNDLYSLQQTNWIDHRTRAVFFEFTLYNPNINLFSFCQLTFEILPTGTIIPTATFKIVNFWTVNRELIITGLMAGYLIIIVFLMIKEIKSFKLNGIKYLQRFWIYINWILFAISWAILPMFLYKLYALHDLLELVNKNSIKTYTNLSTLSKWNETLGILLSACTFLATLKLIELLKFDTNFILLINSIRKCSKGLLSFMIIFLIVSLAYVQLMFIFFNDKTTQYSSFLKSIETNFQIILGKFSVKPILETNFTLGSVIFVSYNIIIVMIMISVLNILLTNNFAAAKLESRRDKTKISLFKHLKYRMFERKMKVQSLKYTEISDLFESKTNQLVTHLNNRI